MLSMRPANVLAVSLVLCAAALGAPGETTTPAQPAMTIRIAGMEGDVEVKLAGAKDWIPAKVGMELGQGAEEQTGTQQQEQRGEPQPDRDPLGADASGDE